MLTDSDNFYIILTAANMCTQYMYL